MNGGHSLDRHIPVLDGLRGLAILAVIVCHVNFVYRSPSDPGDLSELFANWFGWGWAGVDLFFVLSGFLITGILYDAKGCDGYFRNFYARRTLRIMPLYFGFLLFLIVGSRLLRCSFFPWISLNDALALGSYTFNFHVVFIHGATDLVDFWSLAVEEHFYLFWPLFVWGTGRRPLMKLCLALAATSLVLRLMVVYSGTWPPTAYFATPCRLDGLLAGSFVALARRDGTDWAWLRRNARRFMCGSGGLLLVMVLRKATMDDRLVLTFGIGALALFFSGLIVLAVDAEEGCRLRRVLEHHGLRAVGKYSYGIYVFHSLILMTGAQALSSRIHHTGLVAKLLALIWVSAASFTAASLSYHLYEKHFLRLKRLFEYRAPNCSAPFLSAHRVLSDHT